MTQRDNHLTLWVSTDGGRNYGHARTQFLGEEGDFRDCADFWRFGQAREFMIRCAISSPTRVDILAIEVEAEVER